MANRRRTPWYLVVTAVVLGAFAVWCVLLVVSVRSLRADVEDNVGLLIETRVLADAVYQTRTAAKTGADRQKVERQVAGFVTMVSHNHAAGSKAHARAQAFVSAAKQFLAADSAELATKRSAVTKAQGALIRTLRVTTSKLSTDLASKWTSLYIVVSVTLVMAVAILWLLLVAHRGRLAVESAHAELEVRLGTLQQTAERIADGDLASPVEAKGADYDDYERALEGIRSELVGQIDELDRRNREIRGLNKELRYQISERSRHLTRALATLSSKQEAIEPGTVFAERYEIVAKLGAGTHGVVFRAKRKTDDLSVAVKVLKRVDDPVVIARFMREARTLAKLDHDNVVGIHDVGIAPTGEVYLATELVAGPNLYAMRMRFGDCAWAVPILKDVASALVAVHALDVVHRDLKPGNVVLDAGGDEVTAKLIDFGIARVEHEASPSTSEQSGASKATQSVDDPEATEDTPETASVRTRDGVVLGTPGYVAPELVLSTNPATPAADMFSFGVMAYRMLSGDKPFSAPPYNLARRGALPKPAPLGPKCAGLDAEVARLVEACLSMSMVKRPTASAMLAALSEV